MVGDESPLDNRSMRDQPKPTSEAKLVVIIMAFVLFVGLVLFGWFWYALGRGGI
jgi:hypothetical protein